MSDNLQPSLNMPLYPIKFVTLRLPHPPPTYSIPIPTALKVFSFSRIHSLGEAIRPSMYMNMYSYCVTSCTLPYCLIWYSAR